jgi:hypothetical protein
MSWGGEGTRPSSARAFALCACLAVAWTVFGLLAWRSSNGRDTLRRLSCAALFWLGAWSIQAGWTVRTRCVALGVWLLAVVGAVYLTGR